MSKFQIVAIHENGEKLYLSLDKRDHSPIFISEKDRGRFRTVKEFPPFETVEKAEKHIENLRVHNPLIVSVIEDKYGFKVKVEEV